jgi:flagellar biosynthetic protein FlhB
MEDSEDKTEAPTEKRVFDAKMKGDLPFSREALVACSAGVLTLEAVMLWPSVSASVLSSLSRMMSDVAETRIAEASVMSQIAVLAVAGTWILIWPILACRICVGLAANVFQIGFNAQPDRITPKAERISPLRNARRLIDRNALGAFALNILKMASAIAIVAAPIAKLGSGPIKYLADRVFG